MTTIASSSTAVRLLNSMRKCQLSAVQHSDQPTNGTLVSGNVTEIPRIPPSSIATSPLGLSDDSRITALISLTGMTKMNERLAAEQSGCGKRHDNVKR